MGDYAATTRRTISIHQPCTGLARHCELCGDAVVRVMARRPSDGRGCGRSGASAAGLLRTVASSTSRVDDCANLVVRSAGFQLVTTYRGRLAGSTRASNAPEVRTTSVRCRRVYPHHRRDTNQATPRDEVGAATSRETQSLGSRWRPAGGHHPRSALESGWLDFQHSPAASPHRCWNSVRRAFRHFQWSRVAGPPRSAGHHQPTTGRQLSI